MNFDGGSDRKKFLRFFGTPYKSACGIMTLKSAVILLSTIDIIFGIINLIFAISSLQSWYLFGPLHINELIRLISFIINFSNIPFAFIGLKGILNMNSKFLSIYRKFKIFELFTEAALEIISLEMTILTRQHLHKRLLIYKSILFLCLSTASFFSTKIIWSAYVRVKYSEYLMVIHGESALILIEQHKINIMNGKNIKPETQIYLQVIDEADNLK